MVEGGANVLPTTGGGQEGGGEGDALTTCTERQRGGRRERAVMGRHPFKEVWRRWGASRQRHHTVASGTGRGGQSGIDRGVTHDRQRPDHGGHGRAGGATP
jgi:hypothetical protein